MLNLTITAGSFKVSNKIFLDHLSKEFLNSLDYGNLNPPKKQNYQLR